MSIGEIHASEMNIVQDSTVLVTGGCGFIGSHLVEALVARGARVWVLDNLRAGTLDNVQAVRHMVGVIVGDVRDSACVRRTFEICRPQVVFHLAANASVPGSVEDPVYDFETNCTGTFVVLNALREFDFCKRVVLASSGAVYGQPQSFPISEASAIDPISPYGSGKAGAELTARTFFRVYRTPVVVARLFNSYGPRMARFAILDFLRKLRHDPSSLEILGNGEQRRDFTFVTDTVAGLILLAERGRMAESYNVSSGRSITITEMAYALFAALGLSTATRITYTGSSWPGDAQRWEVDIAKIRALGYSPEISLVDGLSRTARWFQESQSG